MRFFRGWTRGSSEANPIATECQSFLAGRYDQHLRSVGRTLPSWTRLNQLSHGSATDIRSLASGHSSYEDDPEWAAAMRFLAAELLARAGVATSLAVLQRDVLVSVELEMANR